MKIFFLILSVLFHISITTGSAIEPLEKDLNGRIANLEEKLDKVLTLVKDIDKVYACESPRFVNSTGYNDDKVYLFGDVVSIYCLSEHTLVGDRKRQCLGRNKWSGDTRCKPSECYRPKLENGFYEGNSTYIRDVLHAHCDKGFVLRGRSEVTCLSSLFWTVLPVCLPTCETPSVPNSNIADVIDVFINGSKIDIRCKFGYILGGPSRLRCIGLNRWSSTAVCKLNDCGEPPDVEFGSYVGNYTTTFMSNVSVSCNEGYRSIAPPSILCGPREWIGRPKCLARVCVDVTLHNGTSTTVCSLKYLNSDIRYMQTDDMLQTNDQTTCLAHCLSDRQNITYVKLYNGYCVCSTSRYVYKKSLKDSFVYQIELDNMPLFL